MKLKDFLTLKVGSGVLVSGTRYNPLINYDWSTTTTSGLRYLRDVGSTPTYNASMYFGRGAYFNGVDQRLEDVLLKEPLEDIGVLCFRANPSNLNVSYIISNAAGSVRFYVKKEPAGWLVGLADTIINTGIIVKAGEAKDIILAWNSGTFTLSVGNDSYSNTYSGSCAGINKLTVSSSQRYTRTYFGGVLKDMYIFNRALTQSEITQFYEQPEAFYAMAQADSTCMLNMPMCETDKYVRNMKSYSLGTNLADINLSSIITGTGNTIVQDVNVFNISSVTASNAVYYPIIVFSPNTFTSDLYNIEVEVKCTSGTLKVARLECTSSLAPNDILTAGTTKTYSIVAGFENFGGRRGAIILDGLNYPTYTAEVTVKRVEKITAGIYPITNYTSSVRDNAKKLQYGLQTCKFVRNSLGVIQRASDYLECDGVSYANTGWTPDLTKELSIEFIVKNNDNLTENILIGCVDAPAERLALGFRGKNARILLGNVHPQYTIASTVYYGTLTMTGIAGQSIMYINGVSKGLVGESTLGIPLSMFWLGGIPLANYKKIGIRLFKVHNKVLTQAEITKNYNSYVAKGLLT